MTTTAVGIYNFFVFIKGGFFIKEINIVAPKEYAFLGRKLSETISRILGFRPHFQLITEYNEDQLPVIFLGSPHENNYTKKYLTYTVNLKNRSGACYGYIGSKALLFGDGSFESALELKELFERYEKNFNGIKKKATFSFLNKLDLLSSKGPDRKSGPDFFSEKGKSFISGIASGKKRISSIGFIKKYIFLSSNSAAHILSLLQTDAAASFFMEEDFREWAEKSQET